MPDSPTPGLSTKINPFWKGDDVRYMRYHFIAMPKDTKCSLFPPLRIQKLSIKVPLWSKKSLPFFLEILKVCLLNTWLAKFWPLIFIQKLFTLKVNFGFHDPPLLTFKPDRPGKVTSKAHQLRISACERSLLYTQSASLKVWKPKTPVLPINSVAYTRIAFLN